jgi:hypothetical protein
MNNIASVHMKLKGEYRLVVNAGREDERDTGWMDNLVLDAGLDRIGSGSTGFFDYCSVGTGSTAPNASQTALVTYLAHKSKNSSTATNLGSATYAGQYTATYIFAQGAVIGNIAELGVGWSVGGSGLFSRSLIVDGGGSPTTITLIAIDQLTVYYRLTNTPAITDATGSVVLDSITYNWTARLALAATFFYQTSGFETWIANFRGSTSGSASYPSTSTIGAITSNPSGAATSLDGFTESYATYTPGNFYRDCSMTLGVSIGNSAGGIGALLIQFGATGGSINYGQWQYAFDAPIPKDNTKTLVLTFRYSWGR